jgi:hypothetical protein
MADYWYLLDAELFDRRIRPALGESWRQRSFAPCRELCRDFLARVEEFHRRYHITAEVPLLAQVAGGLVFDRQFCRALAGELLLYGAEAMPELQMALDSLLLLTAPERFGQADRQRDRLSPIEQAYLGSRNLTFAGMCYRPGHSGYNNAEDVRRLAGWLTSLDPAGWQPESLALLPGLAPEDRTEELAWARDWLAALREVYAGAAEQGQVLVYESI